jgi:hypothetical protein
MSSGLSSRWTLQPCLGSWNLQSKAVGTGSISWRIVYRHFSHDMLQEGLEELGRKFMLRFETKTSASTSRGFRMQKARSYKHGFMSSGEREQMN